ncbi:alpha-1,4-glucan--maltose-1-phosphate maltosyltransferase [Polaromonas aquatica]|uniref:alpha-1,4-glucan--maltose-1-phosphate maltosyltransferase n=1 Tax=Polaromonas aquatica TaxID=332657 RepID=UPI003D65CBBA
MPFFRPRIYQFDAYEPIAGPDTAGLPAELESEIRDAAAAGFDHLLCDANTAADGVLTAAKSAGMAPLLRFSSLSLAREAPPAAASDELPDPRFAQAVRPQPSIDLNDARAQRCLQEHWSARLIETVRADGWAGVCLDLGGDEPPAVFKAVIAAVKLVSPDCKFLAWTPGVAAGRLASLVGCGFDGAFTSGAWWDFRAAWLAEEAARLRPFGALIATVALAGQKSSGWPAPRPYGGPARFESELWLAALTGDGLLVSREGMALANGGPAMSVPPLALKPALALCVSRPAAPTMGKQWRMLSAPDAPVAILEAAAVPQDEAGRWVLVTNAGDTPVSLDLAAALARFDGLAAARSLWPAAEAPQGPLELARAEARVFAAVAGKSTGLGPRDARRALRTALQAPRIAIERISPSVDNGRFVAKRCVGDRLAVEADIFGEGHDLLAARLHWRMANEEDWQEVPLRLLANDRWRVELPLNRLGRYEFHIEAWPDVFGAYRDEISKKNAAGQDLALELREGRLLLEAAFVRAEQEDRRELKRGLKRVIDQLGTARSPTAQVTLLLSEELQALMEQADPRTFSVHTAALKVDAERRAAGFSSWYELFPRSLGPEGRHGRLLDVVERLPAIAAMGFDTLYFPPIHPIGRKHRKGPNNSLQAGADDPGSPYAIGSAEGGHDAIHPELGTLEDFRALNRAAKAHGLELALDFAIQCSPDHPWLQSHPDWFSWRPDGSIRYAENPPKKYQDIVNVDFYAPGALSKLWLALRDIVLFWVAEGVKVFRVDNPHTKPMPFWEWLIDEVRSRSPEVIFLSEAFTRPKPMYRLAKLGFSQSYSYFTWRHTKQEFIDYLTELTQGEPRDFFRPHFFVNTPDINPYFLQHSGRAGFVIRAALAATLSGLWGLYSGFELCEAEPVPGKEEYLDSEKYQLRARDWNQPGNIVREVTLLNAARQANPALQSHLGLKFCRSSGEDVLCFTKTAPDLPGGGRNIVFVAICLDPHAAHSCDFELPLEDWGLTEGAAVAAEDLVHGKRFMLQGRHQTLRLDPGELAFSIWRLSPP